MTLRFYAQVGSLILLKILPYRETEFRYLVYNTLTESVVRLDAIGQSCVQLPENHALFSPMAIICKRAILNSFDNNNQTNNLKFSTQNLRPQW